MMRGRLFKSESVSRSGLVGTDVFEKICPTFVVALPKAIVAGLVGTDVFEKICPTFVAPFPKCVIVPSLLIATLEAWV